MNRNHASLLACAGYSLAGILAISSTGARANVDEYSVGPSSSVEINLELCSSETQLAVQGDGGTDLDFIVSNPSGASVHSDQGIDDYLSVVVEKSGSGCGTFNLSVTNLGDETNAFQVVLEPISEGSTRVAKYALGGNQSETVEFNACGTSAELNVRGGGNTDLDFVVRNSDGAVVHENDDLTDVTTATLAGLLSDCETFEMDVSNLGDEFNAFLVIVEPDGVSEIAFDGTAPTSSLASGLSGASSVAEGEGAGEYRAEANSALTINLPICGANRVEVRGDGDTDLDFSITDLSGRTVHNDLDLSDVTYATLAPSLEECENFEMVVTNLGEVYNDFSVAITSVDDLGGVSGPGEYRVNQMGATKVLLRTCSVTTVYARGDGDTDLDFTISDSEGEQVHSDFDLTDQTEFEVDPGNECADYQMSVSNLGDVFNVLTVSFDTPPDIPEATEPTTSNSPIAIDAARSSSNTVVGEGAGEYTAPANDTVLVNLPVCETTFLSVEGDGDTDLDYLIRSESGDVVHSDYDLTDVTYTTLSPSGDACETFSMSVENLGGVFNVFQVGYGGAASPNSTAANSVAAAAEAAAAAVEAVAESSGNDEATAVAVDVPDDTISTDGYNRNIAILNRTGEALNFIYWSNSATYDWGDDKLGDTSVLAAGQQWNVHAGDSSSACLFDFRAVTESGRDISFTRIDVCSVTSVKFE
ncbi:hypothetical protein [Erythrobacter sp. Alg231-14]|uniref:hypothetical protein n=1 Tax=Erythrobacter sp. Alg231-14 TaxID=1922225 RepID=UPI000D5614F5